MFLPVRFLLVALALPLGTAGCDADEAASLDGIWFEDASYVGYLVTDPPRLVFYRAQIGAGRDGGACWAISAWRITGVDGDTYDVRSESGTASRFVIRQSGTRLDVNDGAFTYTSIGGVTEAEIASEYPPCSG